MGINIERERILMKGYANKNDVRIFLGVGSNHAKSIYDSLVEETKEEGKEVYLGIDPCRLLKFIHMTKNDVLKYAENEKKDASTQSLATRSIR